MRGDVPAFYARVIIVVEVVKNGNAATFCEEAVHKMRTYKTRAACNQNILWKFHKYRLKRKNRTGFVVCFTLNRRKTQRIKCGDRDGKAQRAPGPEIKLSFGGRRR
jgi:hypothetical protein